MRLDGGKAHVERIQNVKYQNFLDKHFAETPPFLRAKFPITSSMSDLSCLFSDPIATDSLMDLFLTLFSGSSCLQCG